MDNNYDLENSKNSRRSQHHSKGKKRNSTSFFLVFIVFLVIMSAAIGILLTHHLPFIGFDKTGEKGKEGNVKYVYCAASAPIYLERNSEQSIGVLIDVVNYFTDTSIAELIDNDGFPIAISYHAFAHEENRYQIEYGGNTYWIDPYPSLPVTDSTPSP